MSTVQLVRLVARREYLRTIRRRGYVVATLLIPLGAAAFVLLAQLLNPPGGGRPVDPTVYLVDESGLDLRPDPRSPNVVLVDRASIDGLLSSGQAREVYVLPPEYGTEGVVDRVARDFVGTGVERLTRQAAEEQRLAAYLRRALIGDLLPAAEVERLVAPISVKEQLPNGAPAPPLDVARFLLPYAFAFLFLLALFITSGYLLQSVTEERETRAVEIVV